MLTVIGCGNPNRSDDGVGVVVAQSLLAHLRRHPRADVRVFDAGTGGMDVMFQARGSARLIIVDASRSGSEAGAIFTVPGAELAAEREPSYSLHDFRWDHALAAGRKIFRDQFPREVTVFLIEAGSLELGLDLSDVVRRSAERVTAEIQQLIDDYAPPDAGGTSRLLVSRANLYLTRELCEQFLPVAQSVALLEREGKVLIVPLMPGSAGGLLLKQRNVRGDRVIHAQEFFREHGYLEDFVQRSCALQWEAERAALVVKGLPRS